MTTHRKPAPGDRGCEHPYGFDVQDRCRFGCGYVLTQAEIDAIDAEETRQMELMKDVPEMNVHCETMPLVDGGGKVIGAIVACSPREVPTVGVLGWDAASGKPVLSTPIDGEA